jgi:2-hydroxychromene-2-carboxylate isomerase
MAPKRVKYFFAFPSPFAALADARIDDLVAGAGAELVPIPIVPPQIGSPPSGVAAQLQEFKLSYGREDAARWARKLGIPWNPHASAVDATDAAAGCYFAAAAGKERAYRNAVFRARWSEARDIGDRQVLADCAQKAGLSRQAFLDALAARRYHDEVPKALQLCLEERIFGVPICTVDGKRFWGNDRLDFLLDHLRGGAV